MRLDIEQRGHIETIEPGYDEFAVLDTAQSDD
jgi:hypothetical protein